MPGTVFSLDPLISDVVRTFADDHCFKVDSVKCFEPNNIIFRQTAPRNFSVTVEDDKFYLLDVEANEATELTPKTVAKNAEKAFKAGKANVYSSYIEYMKYIDTIKFTKVKECKQDNAPWLTLEMFCNGQRLEVTDAEVLEQNEIIFAKKTVPQLDGLVKDGNKYYQLDVENNKAILVNPKAIAEQAVKDLKKQKFNTDAVKVAERFWLIKSITFKHKAKKS